MKVSECTKCEGCPLRKLFPDNRLVEPEYGKGTRLLIGEAPSEEEAATGKPFVGGSGAWLNAMLPKAGVRREELTVINTIQCRPPDNVFPTDSEARAYISQADGYKAVDHCFKNHVEPLIKARPWTRIDLLGDKALQFVAGKHGIYNWRGSVVEIPSAGYRLIGMPTLHPTAIMRDQKMLPAVINDLRKSLIPPAENYNLYPSLEDVKQFKATKFAFDLETSYQDRNEIKLVGLSAAETTAIVVPWRGAYIEELKRIFENATELITQNGIQFDVPILQDKGFKIKAEIQDVMLLQHLRFPDLPHDLEFIASQFTSKPIWKFDKSNFERYNARDVDVTLQCFNQLKPLLVEHNLMDLYKNVQVPLARICYILQKRGFKMAPDRIQAVRAKLTIDMAKEETHLPEFLKTKIILVNRRKPAPEGYKSPKTGKPVKFIMEPTEEAETPWGSATVVEKYLYHTLELPIQKDPKKDAVSTGKAALEKLTRHCYKLAEKKKETKDWTAIGRGIDAIRKLRKMRSMITLFAKEELAETGIQHPHYNVHGTSSGRLSSSEPNLQNIPESARFLYVPTTPGWKIIDVDFSQIENRLTAWFANDTARLARFDADKNFSEHKYLASKFLGVDYNLVEKSSDPDSPYIRAKKIVHGTNYGEGALMIAKMNDLDFKEVKHMQFQWKQLIADTVKWQERTAAEAARLGYLTTPFGRKRWFYTNKKYTESLSFLPQSTAADIIYRVMIGLMYERIDWPEHRVANIVKVFQALPKPAKLILQVHDSLVLECPPEMVDEVVTILKKVMEQPWSELNNLVIPIGIKVGDSWGEAE